MSEHKFAYKWNLKDGYPAPGIKYHGKKVFGTFICGGGSTMGYKLAGFEHLGGVEIDSPIAYVYKENHKPKYLFVEDIRAFNDRSDLPKELYSLDILDGSPPCSTFSMAGSREKAWGKEKHFREGQAVQVLDDLVFVYCDTIVKLMPKVFILENVKGIIQGNAKAYSREIVRKMTAAGYEVQVFLLNAASMGVPQKRERVFFIGHRKELGFGRLTLAFNERPILLKSAADGIDEPGKKLTSARTLRWSICRVGDSLDKADGGSGFNWIKADPNSVLGTISSGPAQMHWDRSEHLCDNIMKVCGSYPMDYMFKNIDARYLIGMSVPPVMTAQIAHQIYSQWLSKLP